MSNIPNTTICNIVGHTMTVLGNKIYILGGSQIGLIGAEEGYLTQDLTIRSGSSISNRILRVFEFKEESEIGSSNSGPSVELSLLPDNVPTLSGAVTFGGHDKIYYFGGAHTVSESFLSNGTVMNIRPDFHQKLFSYDIPNKKWSISNYKTQPAPYNLYSYSYPGYAFDNERQEGWVFGGVLKNTSYYQVYENKTEQAINQFFRGNELPPQTLSYRLGKQLMRLDTGDSPENQPFSVSSDAENTPDPNLASRMVYIPNVGERGVLVKVGGAELSKFNAITTVRIPIQILDIATNKWYTQNSTMEDIEPTESMPYSIMQTGDAMPWFCAVAASAEDNSSHNIYMYALHVQYNPLTDARSTTVYNEMYILSLPSFRWFSADTYKALDPLNYRRYRPECVKLPQQNTHMFIYGGSKPEGCYGSQAEEMRLFDMSSLEFRTKRPADMGAKYTVPKLLYSVLGGGPNGGANITTPSIDFVDPELKNIFHMRITTPNNTLSGSGTSPSPSNISDLKKPEGDGKLSVGVIAGIALSCLVVLGAILVLILYFLRRRRRQQKIPSGPVFYTNELEGQIKAELSGQNLAEMAPGGRGMMAWEMQGSTPRQRYNGRIAWENPQELDASNPHELDTSLPIKKGERGN